MRSSHSSWRADFTWGSHCRSTARRSPAIATSARTFLCSSDGSMSMWIFLACSAYDASLPVTRSSNRMPSAISRSASWIASLTHDSPCIPIMPRLSGWSAGSVPMPSNVIATGTCASSASCRSSSIAPLLKMPWPARITGRFAAASSAVALASDSAIGAVLSGAAQRSGQFLVLSTACGSQSASSCCAFFVMSTSTGPGRPEVAIRNASRSVGAMSAARVTR